MKVVCCRVVACGKGKDNLLWKISGNNHLLGIFPCTIGDNSGEAKNSGSEEHRLRIGVPILFIGLEENWNDTK